jgi:hypothetical protein
LSGGGRDATYFATLCFSRLTKKKWCEIFDTGGIDRIGACICYMFLVTIELSLALLQNMSVVSVDKISLISDHQVDVIYTI